MYLAGSKDERVLVAIDRKGRAHLYDILAAPLIDRSLPLLKIMELPNMEGDCVVIDCQNSPKDGRCILIIDLLLVTFSHGEILSLNLKTLNL